MAGRGGLVRRQLFGLETFSPRKADAGGEDASGRDVYELFSHQVQVHASNSSVALAN